MNLPIIGFCEGDLEIFESISQTESYIEPIDVRDGSWVLFDSEGFIIELKIEPWFFSEKVKIKLGEKVEQNREELMRLLRNFLLRVGILEEKLEGLDLNHLIKKAREFV